jgi:hypothetical protein
MKPSMRDFEQWGDRAMAIVFSLVILFLMVINAHS